MYAASSMGLVSFVALSSSPMRETVGMTTKSMSVCISPRILCTCLHFVFLSLHFGSGSDLRKVQSDQHPSSALTPSILSMSVPSNPFVDKPRQFQLLFHPGTFFHTTPQIVYILHQHTTSFHHHHTVIRLSTTSTTP